MKYGKVEGISVPVSRAVIGSMIFNPDAPQNCYDLLDEFGKLGGNCIDSAKGYGGAEKAIGMYFKARNNREKWLLLTKGCHPENNKKRVTVEGIREDLGISFGRLDTPYIDMWMFHRDDPDVPVGPLVEELNEWIGKGKIRTLGASNWTGPRIDEFNEYAQKKGLKGFVASSTNLSLAVAKEAMWAGSFSVSPEDKVWHTKKQFPLLAWSSQARGFFSGRFAPDKTEGVDKDVVRVYYSPDNFERLRRATELGKKKGLSAVQIAFAYVMQQTFPTWCLIGPANLDELRSSVDALNVVVTPEECRWLNLETDKL
jgi:aryl-alcohol dehydrogenase-like predicted oxidoreductase